MVVRSKEHESPGGHLFHSSTAVQRKPEAATEPIEMPINWGLFDQQKHNKLLEWIYPIRVGY